MRAEEAVRRVADHLLDALDRGGATQVPLDSLRAGYDRWNSRWMAPLIDVGDRLFFCHSFFVSRASDKKLK